jgi:hypothetical protein
MQKQKQDVQKMLSGKREVIEVTIQVVHDLQKDHLDSQY